MGVNAVSTRPSSVSTSLQLLAGMERTAFVSQQWHVLNMQVSVAGDGSFKCFDLQKCWLNLLSSRIPVLLVAVDDPLLTCADRLLQHWRKAGASY